MAASGFICSRYPLSVLPPLLSAVGGVFKALFLKSALLIFVGVFIISVWVVLALETPGFGFPMIYLPLTLLAFKIYLVWLAGLIGLSSGVSSTLPVLEYLSGY